MDKRYKHLNGEERGVILAEHRRGASLQAIGLLLGRSASTIGQELFRGRTEGEPAQPYCAQLGGAGYRARRKLCGRRRKLVPGGWLHGFVRGKLITHALVSRADCAQTDRHAPRRSDPADQPRDDLCRDLRAAERWAESRDDRGAAPAQTIPRTSAHHAARWLYRPGIIADNPSPRGNRRPPCAGALASRLTGRCPCRPDARSHPQRSPRSGRAAHFRAGLQDLLQRR